MRYVLRRKKASAHGDDAVQNSAPEAGLSGGQTRLGFLDGLRAAAALYVVFCHAYQEILYRTGSGVPGGILKSLRFLAFGHYAVDVFIVLSGYCLMLPVVRSAHGELRGGIGQYLARRARRILPPYYASVALSLAVVSATAWLLPAAAREASISRAFSLPVLISHASMTHNLVPGASGCINPPLWSVATEWQIYFVFPLLLLPVWRRFGVAAAVAAGAFVGMIPVFTGATWMYDAAPWYIGLFAMGMAAATLSFSRSEAHDWARRISWGPIAIALAAAFFGIGVARMGWYQTNRWVADGLAGAASMALILTCASAVRQGRLRQPALRFLESRIATRLGAFSYSIYLVHYPLIQLAHVSMMRAGISPVLRAACMITVVPVAITGIAYLFYCLVERRFASQPVPAERARVAVSARSAATVA